LLQAQRHDRGLIHDVSAPVARRAVQWCEDERASLVERCASGLKKREYLITVGRIKQLDDVIAQLEELYRKHRTQEDEEDEDDG
jgi:hypothetical protein